MSICRLFIDQPLGLSDHVVIRDSDFHYLKNVLRAKNDDVIELFNGVEGAWVSKIIELTKARCVVQITEQVKKQIPPPKVTLYFAPIRQNRMDILIEKATEIGVFEFHPILTEFTQVRKVNVQRLQAQIKEASEQSEHLHVAKIYEPVSFSSVLKSQNDLWICDERREGNHILGMKALEHIYLVIGPEGGFCDKEKKMMEPLTRVSLGNSILRAETAAICAVSFANYLYS
jgi:16S rRNA (uracil1498-N3)-methyltransferase